MKLNNLQVVFLAFGTRTDIYKQIYFCLRSFQKYGYKDITFNMVTDNPGMFTRLEEQVSVHVINNETMESWRGQHDFMWRIKMKAIELIVDKFPLSHVLYFDSDTILEASPNHLLELLDNGYSLMHEEEEVIAQSTRSGSKGLTKTLNGFSWEGFEFQPNTKMHNAGVIGLPANKAKELITQSIGLCDALCSTNSIDTYLEQLAFSMVLSSSEHFKNTDQLVIHYWGNKPEWDKTIDQFFVESYFQNLSLENELARFKTLNLKKIPIRSREKMGSQRLKNLATRLYPRKKESFFNGLKDNHS